MTYKQGIGIGIGSPLSLDSFRREEVDGKELGPRLDGELMGVNHGNIYTFSSLLYSLSSPQLSPVRPTYLSYGR